MTTNQKTVAAFDYPQWEEKLKASLPPNPDDDPGSSPTGRNPHPSASTGESDDLAGTVIPSERSERGTPPKPWPVPNFTG